MSLLGLDVDDDVVGQAHPGASAAPGPLHELGRIEPRLEQVLAESVDQGVQVVVAPVVLPQVWNQLSRLVNELPRLVSQWQDSLMLLPEYYPSLFTESSVAMSSYLPK